MREKVGLQRQRLEFKIKKIERQNSAGRRAFSGFSKRGIDIRSLLPEKPIFDRNYATEKKICTSRPETGK
ncbi:MAG: hypothetical protein H6565_11825 [Lewinellaceae bacterium]|nr:hypothetical protein [Lewinellaceae bacterium]